MRKTLTIGLFILSTIMSYGQSSVFKGQLIDRSGDAVEEQTDIIFPISGKKAQTDSSGKFIVDVSNEDHRVFYCESYMSRSKIFRFQQGMVPTVTQRILMTDTAFYVYYQKIKTCPVCLGCDDIIPIRYGYPTKTMVQEAKDGKIALGGCFLEEPIYYCRKDKFRF